MTSSEYIINFIYTNALFSESVHNANKCYWSLNWEGSSNKDQCNVCSDFMTTHFSCLIWMNLFHIIEQVTWHANVTITEQPTNTNSKAVFLLWIIYVISVLFCYAFMHVCLLMPCGHLLGKGWSLGFPLWCLIVTLSLSHWYPGSGVVLDCTDSWYLPSFLLWRDTNTTNKNT